MGDRIILPVLEGGVAEHGLASRKIFRPPFCFASRNIQLQLALVALPSLVTRSQSDSRCLTTAAMTTPKTSKYHLPMTPPEAAQPICKDLCRFGALSTLTSDQLC